MKRIMNNRAESLSIFEPLESRELYAITPGALDQTFSFDGKQVLSFPGGGVGIASDSVIQGDGKTIVVGRVDFKVGGKTIRKFGVARFNFDGTIDRSFGTDGSGTVTFDMGNKQNAAATAVALQGDGGIVVVGSAEIDRFLATDTREFAVARLLGNGRLDNSFSGDGKQTIRIKDDSFANDVAIDNRNRIVV